MPITGALTPKWTPFHRSLNPNYCAGLPFMSAWNLAALRTYSSLRRPYHLQTDTTRGHWLPRPFQWSGRRGIKRLRDAGREVIVAYLKKSAWTWTENSLLFIPNTVPTSFKMGPIGRWVYRDGEKPILLSSPLTQMIAHKHRSECAAILVGRRTALTDNPIWQPASGAERIRSGLSSTRTSLLPPTPPVWRTGTYLGVYAERTPPNITRSTTSTSTFGRIFCPKSWNNYSKKHPIGLVEGGAAVLQSFIDADLWDEADIELCLKK
jgi:diaminohydroxyphosphoribosylaminopyrimidine deaminase/5-amino-6-(5-phosphoribosylamino)uracil reductase